MSEQSLPEDIYIPYKDYRQHLIKLSENVWYLGYWVGFGEVWARRQMHQWRAAKTPLASRGRHLIRSRDFQERALDAALASLKNCVVLSTTPTYFSQYQAGCLLKSRGFELVNGSCYKHPGYKELSLKNPEHPGIPDRYQHWEHIWYRVIGEPKNIGMPASTPSLNNCGVDAIVGLENLKARDSGEKKGMDGQPRRHYLAVAWLPRETAFPNGWRRFYTGEDYKLGHNFEATGPSKKLLGNVQECPHKWDLEIFKDWMPDFDKYQLA